MVEIIHFDRKFYEIYHSEYVKGLENFKPYHRNFQSFRVLVFVEKHGNVVQISPIQHQWSPYFLGTVFHRIYYKLLLNKIELTWRFSLNLRLISNRSFEISFDIWTFHVKFWLNRLPYHNQTNPLHVSLQYGRTVIQFTTCMDLCCFKVFLRL